MDVFIGNLPADGTLIELNELLGNREVQTRFERHMGRNCFDRDYHFLVVHTESIQAGLALIKQLDGSLFNEQSLTARPYIARAKDSQWDGKDRRINPVTSE